MPNICQITGKTSMVGNNVSHANNKTKRKFNPNLQVKRFFLESEKRFITLKVSAAGIRTIAKVGLENAIKEAQQKGFLAEVK